jgi:hypothetical protein
MVCLYAEFVEDLRVLRNGRNLSAAVYTQLTDVETEVNGMMTYDRLDKVSAEIISRVNHFQFTLPGYQALMPTSEDSGQKWRYTINQPSDLWTKLDFDDAHWHKGLGAFGEIPQTRTPWMGTDLWMRKRFNPGKLSAEDLNNVVIRDFHDGEADIYINGVKTFPLIRSSKGYENRALKQDTRHAILSDADNVVAIHFHVKGTGRSIDLGIYLRAPVDL